jgi:hypothetical protein
LRLLRIRSLKDMGRILGHVWNEKGDEGKGEEMERKVYVMY